MDKIYFDKNNHAEFIKYLSSLGEEEYKAFSKKITPDIGENIGIRMPILRDLAKKLSKNSNTEEMINLLHKYDVYEIKLLEGMLIGALEINNEKLFEYIDSYITRIDNWAVCDSFVGSLKKLVKYRKDDFYSGVKKHLEASNPWEIRYGLIILNCYFNTIEYLEDILDYVEKVKSEHYYVNMGVAWLVSTVYFTDKQMVMEFLKNTEMSKWCVNKAIQKICESLKTTQEEKNEVKRLKR